MSYIKVKDNDSLVRDVNTGAIINVNSSEYKKYLQLKQNNNNSKDKINKLETDINDLKNDISEIKQMLLNLSK